MATDKKQFSFNADEDVAEYLDSLDTGMKARKINEHIRNGMKTPGDIEFRVKDLEAQTKVLASLFADMSEKLRKKLGI